MINGSQINYIQKEITAPVVNNSQNYHPYKKKTRSYSENRLPKLLKQALKENFLSAPMDIPPNATIQQKLLLLLNEQNNEHTLIFKYFCIGKTLYKRKLELEATNTIPEAIQNKFTMNSRQQLDQQTLATNLEQLLDSITCLILVNTSYKAQYFNH
ncbi:hypothetical protein G9A89_013686 [Geosiphon pyriformis]|nr:hypothetical protein G9A89_013686 [Geosiphon pyriformis]